MAEEKRGHGYLLSEILFSVVHIKYRYAFNVNDLTFHCLRMTLREVFAVAGLF